MFKTQHETATGVSWKLKSMSSMAASASAPSSLRPFAQSPQTLAIVNSSKSRCEGNEGGVEGWEESARKGATMTASTSGTASAAGIGTPRVLRGESCPSSSSRSSSLAFPGWLLRGLVLLLEG